MEINATFGKRNKSPYHIYSKTQLISPNMSKNNGANIIDLENGNG